MFKDEKDINHRNEKDYLKNIKLLSNAINQDKSSKGSLKKFLLKDLNTQEKLHTPNHNFCKYKKSDSDKITEKRICRCMNFYNRNDNAQMQKCAFCHFRAKWINKSDYEIIDYEVPIPKVVKSTGGIDLLLKSKIDGSIYATEVKPENSKETLVRMVAEILTYCEISNYYLEDYGKILPAICFFKDSMQWKDYEKFKGNPDFKILMESVQVFYITHTDSSFEIHKLIL